MISLVIALAMAAAEPAAPAAAAAAQAPAKTEKVNKDGLVCKKEPVLGSRMKQRICLTAEQWEQRRQDSRDELDAAQRNQPMRTGN